MILDFLSACEKISPPPYASLYKGAREHSPLAPLHSWLLARCIYTFACFLSAHLERARGCRLTPFVLSALTARRFCARREYRQRSAKARVAHCDGYLSSARIRVDHSRPVVIATTLFCLNGPSKSDAGKKRPPLPVYPGLMELFYQSVRSLASSRDSRQFILARASHISAMAAKGRERQVEMKSRFADSSRATAVTKRPGFRARVDKGEEPHSESSEGDGTREGL